MPRYEATFDIDSKSDSFAARRILERVYDTVREESRAVREGSEDATALLQSFETLQEEVKEPSPGTLTIVYERSEDGFDD